MTKFAVLSDIHSNLDAFEEVLRDIDKLAITDIFSLGDNIGYGPEPEAVIQRLDGLSIPSVLGNHELVVGELESAVEESPYREHLWYLLITALARCGRRVEALRACTRLREELRGVGLTPADRLSTMERQILAGHLPSVVEETNGV